MIIRLIDIVLTLLFGFICIATLDITAPAPLSPNANLKPLYNNMYVVSVDCSGLIHVGGEKTRPIDAKQFERLLSEQLLKQSAREAEVVVGHQQPIVNVKIQVDRRCPITALREVVGVCNALKVPCSVTVKKQKLAQAGA
jgi:biopolymer transport protein ExbD